MVENIILRELIFRLQHTKSGRTSFLVIKFSFFDIQTIITQWRAWGICQQGSERKKHLRKEGKFLTFNFYYVARLEILE